MKLDALDHPKTFDFAARLGVNRPTAIGHLELFWHFVAKHAPRGNVGKHADGAIARACDWQGAPEMFVEVLRQVGFIDPSPAHRWIVHDWSEHCPNWVRAQLRNLKQGFITDEPPPSGSADAASNGCTEEQPIEQSTRARVPSHAKGSHAKPRDTRAEPAPLKLVTDAELMDGFAAIVAVYPKRLEPPSLLDEREYQHRIDEGVPHAELEAGVKRYAAFVTAGGVGGAQYVKAIKTLFAIPNRFWQHAWDPPQSKTDALTAGNQAAAADAKQRLFGGAA